MNKSYKKIFNAVRGAMVAVAETASAASQRGAVAVDGSTRSADCLIAPAVALTLAIAASGSAMAGEDWYQIKDTVATVQTGKSHTSDGDVRLEKADKIVNYGDINIADELNGQVWVGVSFFGKWIDSTISSIDNHGTMNVGSVGISVDVPMLGSIELNSTLTGNLNNHTGANFAFTETASFNNSSLENVLKGLDLFLSNVDLGGIGNVIGQIAPNGAFEYGLISTGTITNDGSFTVGKTTEDGWTGSTTINLGKLTNNSSFQSGLMLNSNNITNGESEAASATMAMDGLVMLGGSFTNNGTVSSSGGAIKGILENALHSGSAESEDGSVSASDILSKVTDQFLNAADVVSHVQLGGTVTNNGSWWMGSGTVEAFKGGIGLIAGEFNNAGSLHAGMLAVTGGTLSNASEGLLDANTLIVIGGSVENSAAATTSGASWDTAGLIDGIGGLAGSTGSWLSSTLTDAFSSVSFVQAGGTVTNKGDWTMTNLGVVAAGTFENDQTVNADALLLTGLGKYANHAGAQTTTDAMLLVSGGKIVNSGTINETGWHFGELTANTIAAGIDAILEDAQADDLPEEVVAGINAAVGAIGQGVDALPGVSHVQLAGSSVESAGDWTMNGVSVIAGGSFDNQGSLTADALVLALTGKLENSGTLTSDMILGAGGSIENKATGSLSTHLLAGVGTSLTNAGDADIDLTAAWNGSIDNSGTLSSHALVMGGEDGTITNSGSINANLIVNALGSTFTNTSSTQDGANAYVGIDASLRNEGQLTLRTSIDASSIQDQLEGLVTDLPVLSDDLKASIEDLIDGVDAEIPLLSFVQTGGTFENSADAELDASGMLLAGGARVDNKGTIQSDALSVSDNAAVVNSGTLEVGVLTAVDGAEIVNSGVLHADAALLDHVRYTHLNNGQDGLQLGLAWFSNSLITFENSTYELQGLGAGNEYVIRTSGEDAAFADRGSILKVDHVGGSNSVHIAAGGVLQAASIGAFEGTTGMSGETAGIYLEGGALETTVGELFTGFAAWGGEAKDDDQVGSVLPGWSVDGLKDNILVSASAGSWLNFTDASLTSSLVGSLTSALEDAGLGSLNINFANGFAENVWSLASANELINAHGSDMTVSFSGVTLNARGAGEGTSSPLYVSTAGEERTLVVQADTGFKNVTGVDAVTVASGRTFLLAGDANTSISLVGSPNAKDAGSVHVEKNAVLQLGLASTQGWSHGRLSSVSVEDGALNIQGGTFELAQVTLEKDASFVNAGEVIGGTLHAEESLYENDGASSWQTIEASEVRNNGTESVVNLKSNRYENAPEAVLTVLQSAAVTTLQNEGLAFFEKDASVELHTVENSGTIAAAGSITVDSLTNTGLMTVEGAAAITNFTQTAGSFTAGSGSTVAGAMTVSGGTVLLGNTTVTGTISVTNGAVFEMSLAEGSVMSGRLNVDGATAYIGDAPMPLSNADTPSSGHDAVLRVDQDGINLGHTGMIAVGEGAAEHQLEHGDVWFGSDSLLVIDTAAAAAGGSIFEGDDNSRFTVEDGAQIALSENGSGWGTYKLMDGFGTVDLDEGGWLDSHNVIGLGGEDIDITLSYDEDGNLTMVVGSNDILEKLPNAAVPNLLNEVIGDTAVRDTTKTNVIGFLSRAVEGTFLAEDLQAATINDTVQIMAAGGLLVQGMTLTENVLNATERRLGFEAADAPAGAPRSALWASALGQRVNASGYEFTGETADFDGTNYGFIMGADVDAADGLRLGAAFSYQKGSIESNGSPVKTSSDADAFGITLYAAKSLGAVRAVGSLGYERIESSLSQTLPSTMKLSAHELDASNDVFTAALRGEMRFALSQNVSFVPYAGLRGVVLRTSDDASTLGGEDAFRYDTETAALLQAPFGVMLVGTNASASGWTSRGAIDLSLTPTFGDKHVDTTIRAQGLTASDRVSTEFADDLTGALRMSLGVQKDNFSLGGDIGISTGGSREGNVTFSLKAGYAF